jgi:glyoxalase superfamily protein
MGLEWEQVIIASRDPVALGRWWCRALGWVVVDDGPVVFEIQAEVDRVPGLLFVPFAGDKVGQNRLHVDLRPDEQDAEVDRLIGLGASRVDVGQGDASWVVLADPEGNEFCVLSARSAST